MKAFTVAVALMTLCSVARAQESSPEVEAAWIQLSDEHIECAELYRIVGICMESADDKSLSEQAMTIQGAMLERATTLTAKAKMKFETINARVTLAQQSLAGEIGKDCRNLSILLAKHGKACRDLYENPAEREIEVIRDQLKPNYRTAPEAK
jgi:hypothetical protein